MPELRFTQSERRTFLGPIAIALAMLLTTAAAAYLYFPHRTADITITHTAILPTHTVIETGSKVVGHQLQPEDDLYVLLTVRIDDKLRIPLFLSDITATLTTADDAVTTTSAIEQSDLAAVTTAFPAIKPLTSPPLLRESTIQPHTPTEGMVILHFPVTHADWDNRKSTTLTITLYHHAPITVTIPK